MSGQPASHGTRSGPAETRDAASRPAASTGIIILGMHRSGTSALSRLLHELGCSLGGVVIGAAADNPEGYFEHAGIVTAHEEFLRLSGRSWSDPRPFAPADFEGPVADAARAKLAALFDRELRSEPRWVLKDPRMCRLLPLWEDILRPGTGTGVACLHVVRDPLATARSLAERDGIGLETSLLLFLRHHLEAEAWTRGCTRAWLDWDRFQHAPAAEVERALRTMRLDQVLDLHRLDDALGRAYKPGLVHHRTDGDVSGDAAALARFPWVRELVAALDACCRGDEEEGRQRMDDVRGELEKPDALLMPGPESEERGAGRHQAAGVMKDIETLRAEAGAARAGEDTSQGGSSPDYYAGLLTRSLDVAAGIERSYQAAVRERDALREENSDLRRTVDAMSSERERLIAERDAARAAHADAEARRIEGREELRRYYENTRSWRMTAPVRRIMNALRGAPRS